MNSALLFLLKRSFINRFKKFIKTPSKVILSLFFIFLIFVTIYSSLNVHNTEFSPKENLFAMIFGYFSLIFVVSIANGIDNGNSSFLMSDINILFTSPIHQREIFTYGLIKSLSASLLGSIFLLYQFNVFTNTFGMTVIHFIMTFFIFSLFMFLFQFTFFCVYSFVSKSERYSLIAKIVFYAPFVLLALYAGYLYLGNKDFLASLVIAVNMPVVDYIPLIGWTVAIIKYMVLGDSYKLLIYIAVEILYFIILYYIMANRNTEFYEDVIASAKNNEKLILARKSGATRTEKFKLSKKNTTSSEIKGSGSSVFFSINKILNKRTNVFIIPRRSLVIVFFTLIATFIFTHASREIFATLMSIYMVLMLYINNRFDSHLRKNYVYLVPDKPFKKLFALILSDLYVLFFETIVLYTILFILMDINMTELVSLAAIRFFACMLIVSINVIIKRFLGAEGTLSRMVFLFGGMFILALVGISGVAVYAITDDNLLITSILVSLISLLISSIFIFISRNLLYYVNLNK